jgi:hypothetical protein
MRQGKRVDTQDIVLMYTVQHLTSEEIGKIIGMSRTAICKRLKKWGIDSKMGTWVRVVCSFCGCDWIVQRSTWRNWKPDEHHYCRSACYYAARENSSYHPWRHGQRLARAIVAQYFDLQSDQIVHHEDGDNHNNDRANLKVFANQSDHMRYHHGKNKADAIWDGSKI